MALRQEMTSGAKEEQVRPLTATVDLDERRISVVAYTQYPSDSRVRREAEFLAEDGRVVHVIALRSRHDRSLTDFAGVRLHELPLSARRGSKLRYLYQYSLFFVLSLVQLIRLHRKGRFDLVHVHSLPDFQVFCALPLRLSGCAVLLDLHEGFPEILAARFPKSSILVRVAAGLEQLSCRFANHVLAANDGIRAAVISRGLSAQRITSIFNSGDPPNEFPSAETIRRRFDLPGGKLIIHAGGVNPERDLETVVRAFAQLTDELDVHLIVAGEGESQYLNSLKAIVEDLGLSDRVRFLGRLDWEQAYALMSLSSVGLVTLATNPLTQIAWPTRIVEYANLEKPLVVPEFRSIRAILGEGAQYYKPGDPNSLAKALRSNLLTPDTHQLAITRAASVCRRFASRHMREILRGVVTKLEDSRAA